MSEFGSHLETVAKQFFNSLSDDVMSRSEKEANIKAFSKIAEAYLRGTNYTDSQAYNSPTSYAKKIQALGTEWTPKHQKAYEQLVKGNFKDNNSNVLFEILKPFCFSNKWISSGLSSGSRGYSQIPISMQNKNSEYLILLFSSIAMNQNGVENQKLKAIHDFMEMSHHSGQVRTKDSNSPEKEGKYNGMGIDTFEFVSASKVAPYGAIDLSGYETYEEVMSALKSWYYVDNETIPQNYNALHVQTVDMDDYGKQTSMIEHLDNEKLEPSQERVILAGDLLDDEILNVDGESMTAIDAIREYEHYQALNIVESADNVALELGAVSKNGKLRGKNNDTFDFDDGSELKRRLSSIFTKSRQKILQSNPEIIAGIEIEPNGNPVIPYGELSQSAKMQQMTNSIIKTRINRQTKDGGAALQISTFGYQNDLSIVFMDENNNRMMNLKEFVEKNHPDIVWRETQFAKGDKKLNSQSKSLLNEYKNYVSSNNPVFSHYEILMKCPVTSPLRSIKEFRRKDGSLMSVQEMRDYILNNPDTTPISIGDFEKSLEVIASRVPFESLYSCFPCKIKNWLPDTAGMAMAFPKEATLISGFDFDGDKAHYTMRTLNYTGGGKGSVKYTFDRYDDSLDEAGNLKNPFNASRSNRNNRIFDLKLAFARSKSATVRMFSPGSFDDQKRLKYMIGIAQNNVVNPKTNSKYTFSELQNMDFNELREVYNSIETNLDVASSSTQIYYHRVNSSAQVDIGGTANNNTSHAMLTHADIRILFGKADRDIIYYNRSGLEHKHNIRLFGVDLTSDDGIRFDPIFSMDGSYTSRILANFLDAFVDTTKESVGEELNVNAATLGVMCTLARIGFSKENIALFLTQPILIEAVQRYFSGNSKKSSSSNMNYIVNDVYYELLNSISKNDNEKNDIETKMWNVLDSDNGITTDNMFDRISGNMTEYDSKIFDLAILKMFKILNNKSKAVNSLTKITQFNSIRNSPGPEHLDTFLLREQIESFLNDEQDPDRRNFIGAERVFDNEIVKAFYDNTISRNSITERINERLFVECSPVMTDLLHQFCKMFKFNPSREAFNYLIRDYVYYHGIETGVFNNDTDTRNFLINEFSDAFRDHSNRVFRGIALDDRNSIEQAWNTILDNAFVKKLVYNGKNSKNKLETSELKINFADETDINEKQDIIASFEDLLTSENKYVKAFGKNMLSYMIIKNGLNFSNLTMYTSLSSRTKIEMNEIFKSPDGESYFDLFNPDRYTDKTNSFDRFFELFIRNRSYLDNMLPVASFGSSNKKYSHSFSDDGSTVTLKGKTMSDLRMFTISDKHSESSFIKYFKDRLGNIYKIVDGSFVKNNVVKTDGKKETSFEISYEKISKLSVKNHYVQYFSEGDIDE